MAFFTYFQSSFFFPILSSVLLFRFEKIKLYLQKQNKNDSSSSLINLILSLRHIDQHSPFISPLINLSTNIISLSNISIYHLNLLLFLLPSVSIMTSKAFQILSDN